MNEAKIQLSQAEMELIANAEILLTKNRILQKVKLLLEQLQHQMINFPRNTDCLPEEWFIISPKISKGENYLGLPYLILDYPRNFGTEDIFAIRTMFWWGNFFSSTLHLTGKYKKLLLTNAPKAFDQLQHSFFICTNTNQWQHHFEPDNYIALNQISFEEFMNICQSLPHIKIATKWPVTQWHLVANNLWKNWMQLLSLLVNYQGGETNL